MPAGVDAFTHLSCDDRYLASVRISIWNGWEARNIVECQCFFFASLRVGGLKYFLTNLWCIAKTTLLLLDVPEAHDFCESR